MTTPQKQHQAQEWIHKIIAFTKPYPMTPRLASKIFRAYGEDSLQQLCQNPYALSRDVAGIGDQTAKDIALIIEQKLGTTFTKPPMVNPEAPRYHYGGPGKGKLSPEKIEVLKQKLQHTPADIFPTEISGPPQNPYHWTITDLRIAIKHWFNVTWAHDSSYRALLQKCGLVYNRKLRHFEPSDEEVTDLKLRNRNK